MKGFVFGLVVIGCVAGCTTKAALTPNEQLAEKAKASVRDTLKDPTSAKFKEVRASAKGNCIYGKLLAKNSYGAYTGYQEFAWYAGKTYIKPDQQSLLAEAKTTDSDQLSAFTDYTRAYTACIEVSIRSNAPDTTSDIPDDATS